MQFISKQRLTKVALALIVAGYCAAPAVAANGNLKSGQWQIVSESTGTIQGTVPWITRDTQKTAETDKNHVTVTIDRGGRAASTEGDKQFHVGDKVTVNWAIGDTEGDLDDNNTATKGTVQWMSYSDQSGGDAKEIGSKGSDTYEIQAEDADRYIGIKITPTTTTGDPAVAQELLLNDLSTDAGGGSDDDDVPEGPVVNESVKVVIYEAGSTTNLLGSDTKLKTNTTYKVLLWSDKNSNSKYDTGEEVTSQYDYRWKFTGNSAIASTGASGIVNESWNDKDLVIPVTNAEAKTAFEGADGGVTVGTDGVQGFGLSIDYKRK
jgi:hypothetical protein